MDFSFVIVNYNTTAHTQACVQSIYDFTERNTFEIIVVDNASTDTSIKNITNQYPQIIFIQNAENLGFGQANNKGIEIAKGKYLFLLNSDTLLTSDAGHTFFTFMEAEDNRKIACCGAALFDIAGNGQISYGNFPSISEALSSLGFLRLYKGYYCKYLSSGVINYSDKVRPVDYLCGADLFLRKSVIEKIGGFDPDFFLYFEEVDLFARLQKFGYISVIIPEVKIIHHEGASVGGSDLINHMKMNYYASSRRKYFKKWHGSIAALVINKIYALQALIFLVLKREPEYLRSARILFRT